MLKKIICLLAPWKIRRILLINFFDYEIHKSAKIGFSWIYPHKLIMSAGAKIEHFSIAINLDYIEMSEKSYIGSWNWITGFTTKVKSRHFSHQPNRKAELLLGKESAITKRHHLDCTNSIIIGKFTTIAGYHSQFLTHSINIINSIQDSTPIVIGDYCFVGTNSVILGGSRLPNCSVLGAKSLLTKNFDTQYHLYGGVPAKAIKEIPMDAKYFNREEGFIY